MKRVAIVLFLSLFLVTPVEAAKPRVRTSAAKAPVATSTGYSTAKLSRGTNSVNVTFLNLSKVTRVTYTLAYTANGVEQGAMGSITPTGQSTDTRNLYFGTCSHGVCTPHRNISGATLTIETQLKSGGVNVKRYKIKL
jgi:hypothetical protein